MVRVMIVDDSPLVRKIAADILGGDPEIEVVATAAQAEFALNKLEKDRPDVITLDLEMPGMGGMDAIRRIMSTRPTPIVVMSAHAREGAEQTLQALELGAVEFVSKPSGSLSGGIAAVTKELIEKVKNASRTKLPPAAVHSPGLVDLLPPKSHVPPHRSGSSSSEYEVVAIGASTGGPVALRKVLTALPSELPVGIVIVQHMPPVFTRAFADRLNGFCALEVKEAEDGDWIVPGRVLLAPGDKHMTVYRAGGNRRVALGNGEQVNGHRPSVDVLMQSVADEYGERAVGIIMTGMGKDGAAGLGELHYRGGYVIAQDRQTSVIYGMNREAIEIGAVDEVIPLESIARRIDNLARFGSGASTEMTVEPRWRR